MSTLLDAVLGHLTTSVIGAAASKLGEAEIGVTKAVKALAPTILSGIAGKATDDATFGGVFEKLSDRGAADFLNDIGGLVGGGNIAHGDPKDVAGALMGALFGPKVAAIINSVGAIAGLKTGSASALLGLVGPIVMGVLGKRIQDDRLDRGGLKSLLISESDAIRRAVPTELGTVLGLIPPAAPKPTVVPPPPAAATTTSEPRRAAAWMWAIPAALTLAVIGWMMSRGGDRDGTEIAATPAGAPIIASATPAPTPGAAAAAEISEYSRVLNDFTLKAEVGGVEEKLITFIESGNQPCTDAACWFTFDRLTFATGSATLDMERSRAQLENIRAILAAYPTVQLKIGGYTDNSGDPAANLALSQQRAEAVVAALGAIGVDPARIVAEGFGEQFPVASNETEEGRAQNRRIDVRVRER